MTEISWDEPLRFEIRAYRYLDERGKPLATLPEAAADGRRLAQLMRVMLLVRTFDHRAIALQRTGQMGTYASCYGQEAIGAALGDLMALEDVLLPSYRETPALLMRGATMTDLLLYWGGDERGMDWRTHREDFPLCVPIATHCPQAAGVAFAFKYRRQRRAAVCVLGDGGTSKGDFHEALNLAGTWKLPLLMLVVNNQWAISVPRSAQTGSRTLAQKAIAAGVNSEVLDGNDLIALRARLSAALEQVRAGEPYLIEALTYRLGDHTTADDASRYRTEEEVAWARAADPVSRLEKYLTARGLWSEAEREQCLADCEARVEEAVKAYLATPAEPPESMFDYLYATLPEVYVWQRAQAADKGRGCG